jgi:hypothetical protein
VEADRIRVERSETEVRLLSSSVGLLCDRDAREGLTSDWLRRSIRARSGFSLLPTAEGVVLHGGYCASLVSSFLCVQRGSNAMTSFDPPLSVRLPHQARCTRRARGQRGSPSRTPGSYVWTQKIPPSSSGRSEGPSSRLFPYSFRSRLAQTSRSPSRSFSI